MDLKKIKKQKILLIEKIGTESDAKKKIKLIDEIRRLLFSELSWYADFKDALRQELYIKHDVKIKEDGEGQELWIDGQYIKYISYISGYPQATSILESHGMLRYDKSKIEDDWTSCYIWYEDPDNPLKIEK